LFYLLNLIWRLCRVPSANYFCYQYFVSIYVMLIPWILFIRKRSYTDTSKFTLRCGACQIGVVGQKVIPIQHLMLYFMLDVLLALAWTPLSSYDSEYWFFCEHFRRQWSMHRLPAMLIFKNIDDAVDWFESDTNLCVAYVDLNEPHWWKVVYFVADSKTE